MSLAGEFLQRGGCELGFARPPPSMPAFAPADYDGTNPGRMQEAHKSHWAETHGITMHG